MLEISIYVVGGLAIFFIGLNMAESGLKKGTGDRLQQILSLFTSNTISGMITGLVVTAIIQSSSAVSVMVIGFVSGGVMTFTQGIGVIIGSNIGTTITMHILSLKIKNLEWILCIIGLLLFFSGRFKKQKNVRYAGVVCIGFGLIFLGMSILQIGVLPLKNLPVVVNGLAECGQKPLLAILGGLILTSIIQSSSATSGLVLTLATQGMITLQGGIGIILGSNIGTCVTALLAGIKASPSARRIAYFHVLFNVLGVLFFIPMLEAFSLLIGSLALGLERQIAIAHTVFNLTTALGILPFVRFITRLLNDN